MITIVHSGVPVGKGRPRFVMETGHTYTPTETRRYEKALKLRAVEVMRGRQKMTGTVGVSILASMPMLESFTAAERRAALAGTLRPIGRIDLDNISKVALDALNKVVWSDDNRVVHLTADKIYAEEPSLMIRVWLTGEGA